MTQGVHSKNVHTKTPPSTPILTQYQAGIEAQRSIGIYYYLPPGTMWDGWFNEALGKMKKEEKMSKGKY